MIEYAMIDIDGEISTCWIQLTRPRLQEIPQEEWFSAHSFRINGVQYNKWSEEFVYAFNTDSIWQKLNG